MVLQAGDSMVEIDSRYFRPTEVELLRADISLAKRVLGWEPKVSFSDLIKLMVDHDMINVGLKPPSEGIRALEDKGLHWTDHKFSFHEQIRERVG